MTDTEIPTEMPTLPLPGEYDIDVNHSYAQFSARHFMISTIRGTIPFLSGHLHVDGDDPTRSTVSVVLDPNAVNSGNERRDAHLKTPDFFDVENFPTIEFVGTSIRASGERSYELTGDLTIRGVTKTIVIDATFNGAVRDNRSRDRAGFSGSTTVNRFDFEAAWNAVGETGTLAVGADIRLDIDAEFLKAED